MWAANQKRSDKYAPSNSAVAFATFCLIIQKQIRM